MRGRLKGRRTWKHQEWGEVGGGGPARSPGKALDPAKTDVKPPPRLVHGLHSLRPRPPWVTLCAIGAPTFALLSPQSAPLFLHMSALASLSVSSSGPQGSWLREGEARGSGGCHRAFGCPEEAAEGATGGKARGAGQTGSTGLVECCLPLCPVVQWPQCVLCEPLCGARWTPHSGERLLVR